MMNESILPMPTTPNTSSNHMCEPRGGFKVFQMASQAGACCALALQWHRPTEMSYLAQTCHPISPDPYPTAATGNCDRC